MEPDRESNSKNKQAEATKAVLPLPIVSLKEYKTAGLLSVTSLTDLQQSVEVLSPCLISSRNVHKSFTYLM